MGKEAGQPAKTTPALTGPVHYFRVTLKQVLRVHDIDATLVDVVGRASKELNCFFLKNAVFSRSEADVSVFQTWIRQEEGTGTFKMEAFGDDGKPLPIGDADFDEPTMFFSGHRAKSVRCTLERQSWGHQFVNRTFDRSKSKEIAEGSWVYVLRGDPGTGETASLVKELQFDKSGKFRSVVPELAREKQQWDTARKSAAAARAKDLDRALPLEAALDLQLEHPATGKTPEYYFYLARWRLPWDAVERLEAKPKLYAVRLGDLFHTDVYDATDAKGAGGAEPLIRMPTDAALGSVTVPNVTPNKKQPAYVLHLVDPFIEAHKRSDALGRAARELEPAQNQIAEDDRYRFAKRLELFTARDKSSREIVSARLFKYLYPDGGLDRINRILLMINARAYDVVAWIGQPERRYHEEAHWDVLHKVTGAILQIDKREGPSAEVVEAYPFPRPSTDWVNAYGAAISFYREADPSIWEQVLEADGGAKVHLLETSMGQSYLERELGHLLAEDKELQDTLRIDPAALKKWKMRAHVEGSGLELALKRKAATASGLETWGKFHALYSNAWARKVKAFGLISTRQAGAALEAAEIAEKAAEKLKGPAKSVAQLRAWSDRTRAAVQQTTGSVVSALEKRMDISAEAARGDLQPEGTHGAQEAARRGDGVGGGEAGGQARPPREERHSPPKNDSTGVKVSKAGQDVLQGFQAGLTVWIAFVKIGEADSFPSYLAASGEAFSATKGALEYVAKFKFIGRANKEFLLELAKPLGVFATALEISSKVADVFESHDGGEAVGRVICLSSTLIAAAGVTFASGGVAVVIAGACTVLDFIGNQAAFEFKDSTRFLRACEYGDPEYKLLGKISIPLLPDSWKDKLLGDGPVGLPGDAVGNKYKALKSAPPAEKRWTLEVQNQELVNLMYELKLAVGVDMERERFVRLTPWFAHCFTSEVRWSGYLELVHEELNPTGPGYKEQILATRTQRITLTDEVILVDDKVHRFVVKFGPLAPTAQCSADRLKVTGHVDLTLPGPGNLTVKASQDLRGVHMRERRSFQDQPRAGTQPAAANPAVAQKGP